MSPCKKLKFCQVALENKETLEQRLQLNIYVAPPIPDSPNHQGE
jgi:hypothetical protein